MEVNTRYTVWGVCWEEAVQKVVLFNNKEAAVEYLSYLSGSYDQLHLLKMPVYGKFRKGDEVYGN